MFVPREATATLQRLAKSFPIVAITGPRQSGKTTLAQRCFAGKPCVSLEDLDHREFATHDPRGFLAQFPDGAVLDEVQRCPGVLSYLQGVVDRDRRAGLFILTGSQQFDLLAGITQSLAGRAALLPLLPFSFGELDAAGLASARLEEHLFNGAYPPIHDRKLEPGLWLGNYVSTYLERDVRRMVNVRDLSGFQRFVRLCAGRTGQLLNLSALANDCGITHNTAKAWISVLEASYLVHLLPPHHRNFNKRLIKTPKLYFLDPGLAAWLLGIKDAATLLHHAHRGALFETWVVSELLKGRFNRAQPSNLFFWRDRTGNEVDVVIEDGQTLHPLEVKSGETINADFFAGLRTWTQLAGKAAGSARLVYGGEQAQTRQGIQVLPWRQIGKVAAAV
ncbi:MAG: ATP-binding protein [Verrucomicrobia bacterium]|nr:ATP-binding protein [Verrucomicrobiota bacterium]